MNEYDNNTDANTKKCMGEVPLFPGWLFFEEELPGEQHRISAYGPENRFVKHTSDNREYSIAECLRTILDPKHNE